MLHSVFSIHGHTSEMDVCIKTGERVGKDMEKKTKRKWEGDKWRDRETRDSEWLIETQGETNAREDGKSFQGPEWCKE